MNNLRVITPKMENSLAQCNEVFKYLHKNFSMSESVFKKYVRIDSEGKIRAKPKTSESWDPKLSQAISGLLAVVIVRDKHKEKIADLVIATLPSV